MPLDEPSWWYRQSQPAPLIERAMHPASVAYAWAVERRFRNSQPFRASLPVICIGNLTAGGTGKTPLAMHVARELIALGEQPAFLTRGYGGRIAGPHRVDPKSDDATEVGDEPLLLATTATTFISRDRPTGAQPIAGSKLASVIVMDDGLQNPSLAKDLTIALIDARRGIGNGKVLPAGPLRARLGFQLGLVDAVVVNYPPGVHIDTQTDIHRWLQQEFPGPVLTAAVRPRDDVTWVRGARLVAFAGIANPQRFFRLLRELGGNVVAEVALPDHHAFARRDAERILNLAKTHDALLVTTEKDSTRLTGGKGAIGELLDASRSLGIRLDLKSPETERLTSLLMGALKEPKPA